MIVARRRARTSPEPSKRQRITLRPPFTAESPEALFAAILWRDPAPPATLRPGLPDAVDEVVLRLLQKEPDRRYGDAGAVKAALEAARM